MDKQRQYIAIDLKSFYASVECVERGLDALNTHLVVADKSRTDKTICLAVSPSLKAYGIGGRARLFEVVQRVTEVNNRRRTKAPGGTFAGRSASASELAANPQLALDYIVAPPRMAYYIEYSTRIYKIYLKYIAPEDIHVYSIDEVFIDATNYLGTYGMTAHQLAMTMIRDVLSTTGITATAGIGSNMYLAKIAMDIEAKHMPADADGVRIAELDEMSYRRRLWNHRPLTDFWRVGGGTAQRLARFNMFTMGDIARMSLRSENFLYKLFGVNAELLIDHAWGWEPCTIAQVKAYRPETNSLSSGQVLTRAYTFAQARVVIQEMAEALALDLVDKNLATDHLTVTIGYDAESLVQPHIAAAYRGEVSVDHYGRRVPKHSHAGARLPEHTFSSQIIAHTVLSLFDSAADANLLFRRLNVTCGNVVSWQRALQLRPVPQLNLFSDRQAIQRQQQARSSALNKERRLMEATLQIKKKFGKNALLKGLNFADGATAKERNSQIGGHKA
ncbi:MAG: DNA methylase [Muribaculaceae bacterium]